MVVQECLREFALTLSAVVFDLDGTITRFNIDYLGARHKILTELEKMNLKTSDMTTESSIYSLLKILRSRLEAQTYEKLRRKFYRLLEDMETKAAQEVVLYPGARETLRNIHERDLKMGLVTNNGRVGAGLTLKRFGLEGFFGAIVTRDDCEEMKPDAGPVRKVLAKLNSRVEDAVLVGDGAIDVLAAKAAKLRSIAVGTGPLDVDRLLRTEPDYLLGSIRDLPNLIELL